MVPDLSLLQEHRSFRDERLGITERFVDLQIGGARTIGVLSQPLGASRAMAWVVCHSFGNEQIDLSTSDTAIARGLAAAGHQVLRFQCRGYGDAEDLETTPGLGSQVEDTVQAVEQFREISDADRVGAIGGRFGAAVAADSSDRAGLSSLVLLSPVTNGSRYVSELLRFQAFGEVASGRAESVERLRAQLVERGEVNVLGWILTKEVSEDLERLNLEAALSGFEGSALVVQVSRGERRDRALAALVDRLGEQGAKAELRVVSDRSAVHFGYEHFQPLSATELVDTMGGLNEGLARAVTSWAMEQAW